MSLPIQIHYTEIYFKKIKRYIIQSCLRDKFPKLHNEVNDCTICYFNISSAFRYIYSSVAFLYFLSRELQ